MDKLSDLRAMAFASRLKRLGDRLKADATKLYNEIGVDFNDRWFLVALALSQRDDEVVSEMAAGLGISHAAVSQVARAMEEKGLLEMKADATDRRRTRLRLTPEGHRTVKALKPVWDLIGQCTDEIIAATRSDLFGAITSIEKQLEESSLFDRVSKRLPGK